MRQRSAPAMHRRDNRITVGSIAAVLLSSFVALAAAYGTPAQNMRRVSRTFLSYSDPNLSELAPSKEDLRDRIGENSVGKISPTGVSGGKRCEMSPEEFAKFYPPLLDWISNHVDRQFVHGPNRRVPRVFAATALFHGRDFDDNESCFSRAVATAALIFDGVNALCRF